jgi:hypothetical protein
MVPEKSARYQTTANLRISSVYLVLCCSVINRNPLVQQKHGKILSYQLQI